MTNIDIENILSKILQKPLNILRGQFGTEPSTQTMIECLFLELHSYDSKQLKKKLLSDKAYIALSEDELLKEILDDIFKILKENNGDTFKNVMSCFDNEEFKSIVDVYKKSDIFTTAMDLLYRSSKFYSKTPNNLNKLMARIVRNKNIKTLYDPAIGSGSLAIEVAKSHKNISINGQEISQRDLNICKMLLILDNREEDLKNIHLGNTLINPMHVNNQNLNKFDVIVSNPPMGIREWGYNEVENDKYNRFKRGLPTKNGDYAFISHIAESLNDNGIGVLLVSSGVLFRSGAEGVIRQNLIEENLVDCIISLPTNMLHNTAIAVNLLILNKNKKHDKILFMDVAKNVASSRIQTVLSSEIIEKIGSIYESHIEEDGFSKLVDFEDIKNNDFNLSVNRYILEVEEDENIDISTINDDIKILEKKLQHIQSEIKKYMSK